METRTMVCSHSERSLKRRRYRTAAQVVAAWTQSETTGVWYFGWMRPRKRNRRPSRAWAKVTRAPVRIAPWVAPSVEITMMAVTTTAPAFPRSRSMTRGATVSSSRISAIGTMEK